MCRVQTAAEDFTSKVSDLGKEEATLFAFIRDLTCTITDIIDITEVFEAKIKNNKERLAKARTTLSAVFDQVDMVRNKRRRLTEEATTYIAGLVVAPEAVSKIPTVPSTPVYHERPNFSLVTPSPVRTELVTPSPVRTERVADTTSPYDDATLSSTPTAMDALDHDNGDELLDEDSFTTRHVTGRSTSREARRGQRLAQAFEMSQ